LRDGVVTAPRELRRFERHRVRCATCLRYDTAVRHGVLALQAVEPIEPSPDFRRRLEARLARERVISAEPVLPPRAGIAAALFIAAAVTLLALELVGGRGRVASAPELPPVLFPKPVAQPGVPLVTFQDPRASVLGSEFSPYGTAFVQPVSAAAEPAGAAR
jgi:hypothetical protein